jgi:hypothetical protein
VTVVVTPRCPSASTDSPDIASYDVSSKAAAPGNNQEVSAVTGLVETVSGGWRSLPLSAATGRSMA